MAGESPESISAEWPVFGDLVAVGGRLLREVTFVAEVDAVDHEALIHLNGVTDAHRADLHPALLDAVPASAVRTIGYLLPDELVSSYRFVKAERVPRDAADGSPGWYRLYLEGAPDPRNPRSLPNPLGLAWSLMIGPGARVQEAWDEGAPFRREFTEESVAVSDRGPATLLRGSDSVDGLLVLFDGKSWRTTGLIDALRRYRGDLPAVVLVPSGTHEQRNTLLPYPERIGPAIEALLSGISAETDVRFDEESVILAGQSYGGLASAAVVATRPDLATTAVVQSGSFHFEVDGPLRSPEGQLGDFVRGLGYPMPGRRFVVHAGTEDSGMPELATIFANTAEEAGATVTRRFYSGGHDYAWWRSGMFDALDLLAADRARQ